MWPGSTLSKALQGSKMPKTNRGVQVHMPLSHVFPGCILGLPEHPLGHTADSKKKPSQVGDQQSVETTATWGHLC